MRQNFFLFAQSIFFSETWWLNVYNNSQRASHDSHHRINHPQLLLHNDRFLVSWSTFSIDNPMTCALFETYKFWSLETCDLGSLSPLNIELRLRGRLWSDCWRTPRATRTCPLNIQTSPKQPQLLLFSLYTFRKSVANSFSMKIHSLKHEWK